MTPVEFHRNKHPKVEELINFFSPEMLNKIANSEKKYRLGHFFASDLKAAIMNHIEITEKQYPNPGYRMYYERIFDLMNEVKKDVL